MNCVLGDDASKQTEQTQNTKHQISKPETTQNKIIQVTMKPQKPSNTLRKLMVDVEKANERSKSIMKNDSRKFGGSPAPWS